MAAPLFPACRGERSGAEISEASGGGGLTEIAAMYEDMDGVDDIDAAKLQIEEEMVAQVMRRLEEEINRPCNAGGGREVAAWLTTVLPSSSTAPAFVTAKGNEESCRPSFSHSASTVMASVDVRGVPRRPIRDKTEDIMWPWPWQFPEPAAAAASGEEAGGGGGGSRGGEGFAVEDDVDDEWLTRVLNSVGWVDPEAERGVS